MAQRNLNSIYRYFAIFATNTSQPASILLKA